MKPIIGEIVSSTPVSLAEAASILSNFISKGTGATQEISAYLARTRAAFDELVEYHRHTKPSSGAFKRKGTIKEEEKQRLKRLKEDAFEGQGLVSWDETARHSERSDGNAHVEAGRDENGKADERSNKKKRKKQRELEAAALEGSARSNYVSLANDMEDNGKAEYPEGRDSRKKKKKRDRQEEDGAGNESISDAHMEPPKKKKKEKIVEYELEVERNVQRH